MKSEDSEIPILNVAVRDLVEHTLRSGDLKFQFTGASRTIDAILAHQKVQNSRDDNYSPEVSVSRNFETKGMVFQVSGRIDGVFQYPDRIVIEEIKSTVRDLEQVAERHNPLHWGQLQSYAYLYALENNLSHIETCLTYVHLDSGETKEIQGTHSFNELERFFQDLIDRYARWAWTILEWSGIRNESIAALKFPYAKYRPGQRDMAISVYRTIRDQDKLFVQAATGIGKTMAVVFPAVKAVGEGLIEKVFYLTARTTARTVAEKAAEDLREFGLRLKSLTLTAKDKICFCAEAACTPEECEFAKGHFDRIHQAVAAGFSEDCLSREAVEAIARVHRVCPFELSLELALWSDLIICDYNYAFDPRVYLRRFFQEDNGKYVFLIDEAHNLVDRSREMFSADLRKQPFLDVRRSLKKDLPGLFTIMGRINRWMVRQRKKCEGSGDQHTETCAPEKLYPELTRFQRSAARWLMQNRASPYREDLLDLYFSVSAFLRIAEQYDAGYATCYQKSGNDLRVKLFCMDPATQMEEALTRAGSSVFFSATLSPLYYFRELFGCPDSAQAIALPSPFPENNLRVVAMTSISTLYRDRGQTVDQVCRTLQVMANAHRGNYLFFFPSYEYLTLVHERFENKTPGVDIALQTPNMPEQEREQFLKRFSSENPKTLIGFVVMGGIFGEGIDLIGDRLSGAAVIGVGLPGLDSERDLIRDHFNAVNGKGFEFAYQYPGINRVCQAGGRVIRSETDRGIILLIDQRFSFAKYSSLLPEAWQMRAIQSPSLLEEELKAFWNRHTSPGRTNV